MGASTSRLPSGIDGLGLECRGDYGIKHTESAAKQLEYFIKGNHVNYEFLSNKRRFHNHLPHILVSAAYLGASPNQIGEIYDEGTKELEEWKEDTPSVLTDDDWYTHLGDRKYIRGFHDYFSDKINESQRDWKPIAAEFIAAKSHGLLPGVFGGLLHPLIHLGYAIEMDSSYLAIEALGMSCTEYYDITQNVKFPTEPVPKTVDAAEIFREIRADKSLDGELKACFSISTESLVERFADRVGYYASRLDISDPRETMKSLLYAGALLLSGSQKPDEPQPHFDFFLLHILTASAETVEILFSENGRQVIPESLHPEFLKHLWIMSVAIYINQLRPSLEHSLINTEQISSVEESWKDTIDRALTGPKRHDSHLVKAVRALLVAESLSDDKTGFYAKAAARFVKNHEVADAYTGGRIDYKHMLNVKL